MESLKDLQISRYPSTKDQSLRAWNAADELLLDYIHQENYVLDQPLIVNDRFGFLSCHLTDAQVVINYKSQEKAIQRNLETNDLPPRNLVYADFSNAKSTALALVKIPKSLDLFKLYLHQIHSNLSSEGIVICGFMTKYFTPQLTTIAEMYFEDVTQTKAKKKARLMILRKKKALPTIELIDQIKWQDKIFQQYLGVFSAGHIDYATQFFLEHLSISEQDLTIVDLASGNGVIAAYIRNANPHAKLHLIDDSWLAMESSKMNLITGENHFHFNDGLEDLDDHSIDLVVSNPPFHFDFEPNIEITFNLFNAVAKKLKSNGRFELVANRHLPYKPFLEKLFSNVTVVTQNKQFIIYSCSK